MSGIRIGLLAWANEARRHRFIRIVNLAHHFTKNLSDARSNPLCYWVPIYNSYENSYIFQNLIIHKVLATLSNELPFYFLCLTLTIFKSCWSISAANHIHIQAAEKGLKIKDCPTKCHLTYHCGTVCSIVLITLLYSFGHTVLSVFRFYNALCTVFFTALRSFAQCFHIIRSTRWIVGYKTVTQTKNTALLNHATSSMAVFVI